MAVVVSSTVFTEKDISGNPHVRGYFLIEFRDATYAAGGESLDLSPYMQRVEYVTQPMIASGAVAVEMRANLPDYPGNAGSGRIQAYYAGSSIVTINMSGIGVSIASGQVLVASGGAAAYSGGTSPLSLLFSGRITATASGAIAAGQAAAEVVTGTALSGSRSVIQVLGA